MSAYANQSLDDVIAQNNHRDYSKPNYGRGGRGGRGGMQLIYFKIIGSSRSFVQRNNRSNPYQRAITDITPQFHGNRGGTNPRFEVRRRGGRNFNTRNNKYSREGNINEKWQHDKFENVKTVSNMNRPISISKPPLSTGTKLMISNFASSVSEEDLQQLFGAVGDLKSCELDYDREGKSKGSGCVVFVNYNDAIKAIEEYNDRELDGKAMKIHLLSNGNIAATNSIFSRLK